MRSFNGMNLILKMYHTDWAAIALGALATTTQVVFEGNFLAWFTGVGTSVLLALRIMDLIIEMSNRSRERKEKRKQDERDRS
jgi:hypothetical protein